MIALGPNGLCRQAEPYYYDFVSGEACDDVPDLVTKHVEKCPHCQQQINEFRNVLSKMEGSYGSGQKQIDSAVITLLKLHFAYVGKPVTCQTVRPFLPGMLDPDLQIRVPTPITVHVENCPRCSHDLEIIGQLYLNRKQLYRLSQLFADKPYTDLSKKEKMREAAQSVAAIDLSGITAATVRHLCMSPVYRDALFHERLKLCEGLLADTPPGSFPCESVSSADIFDYVVPYGLDLGDDPYVKFRESLTAHLRNCRACLTKMQVLHKTIYHMAERPNTHFVTVYHMAATREPGHSGNISADYPIEVEVLRDEKECQQPFAALTADVNVVRGKRETREKWRPFFRIATAAAAVVLVGVGLWLTTSVTEAVTIDRIYRTLERVRHLYIATFDAKKAEPLKERWVSRKWNVYMTKTGTELVLWDVPNAVRKVKHPDTGTTETIPLTADAVLRTETQISGSLGIMPFSDVSGIPPDAVWERVEAGSAEPIEGNIEVYELTWNEEMRGGPVVLKKWRVFVDTRTKLPKRVEFHRKPRSKSEYLLKSFVLVDYPNDSEMEVVIKENFL